MTTTPATPHPVLGLFDPPMWDSIRAHDFKLQQCSDCEAFRYPPGPTCSHCLSTSYEWKAPSGQGEIYSWVIFHRGYLPAYPPPYNVISVKLDEGPIMVSNLEGPVPEGSWIGKRVSLCYATMPDGVVLPRFKLA